MQLWDTARVSCSLEVAAGLGSWQFLAVCTVPDSYAKAIWDRTNCVIRPLVQRLENTVSEESWRVCVCVFVLKSVSKHRMPFEAGSKKTPYHKNPSPSSNTHSERWVPPAGSYCQLQAHAVRKWPCADKPSQTSALRASHPCAPTLQSTQQIAVLEQSMFFFIKCTKQVQK